MKRKTYVVSYVMATNAATGQKEKVWYVHLKGYPYVPVFGSIGTLQHARGICRLYNGGEV